MFSECWVSCNDSRVIQCSLDDVKRSQAYILFYTIAKATSTNTENTRSRLQALFEEQADEEIIFNFRNSTIPRFMELKRRLSEPDSRGPALKRRCSALW